MHGVVGEQDVLLHGVHLDTGVVLDASTGDVEALRAEVEQRLFFPVKGLPRAVNDPVMNRIEGGPGYIAAVLGNFCNPPDIFRRDALIRLTDVDIAGVVIGEPRELLREVTTNQPWF